MTVENVNNARLTQQRWLSSDNERKLFREHLGSKLPLVIGVTGHLKIDGKSLSALQDQVRMQLLAWRSEFPSTPFVLLSALAEGADRLVARIAREPEVGAKIVAPLPLPREFYLADFSEAGKREFEQLIAADDVISLELPLLPNASLAEISSPGAARDAQYAQVGAYIAHHSHLLIALWDGDRGKTGGTSEVVRFKLEGVTAPYLQSLGLGGDNESSDRLESGPVFHFYTKRAGDTDTDAPTGSRVLYPKSYEYENEAEAQQFYFGRMFRPLEFFNEHETGSADGALMPPEVVATGVPPELLEPLGYVERLFARADHIAVRYAFRTRLTLVMMSVFVGIGALGFDLSGDLADFEDFHGLAQWSMIGFPILLLLAIALHKFASHGRYQDNHQDHRALAEGLRVQYFWQLGGVGEPVATRYLGKQRTELHWIRRACLASRMFVPDTKVPPSGSLLALVERYWIANQHRYFVKQSRREHKKLEILETLTGVLFLSGLDIITVVSLVNFHTIRDLLPEQLLPTAELLSEHHSSAHVTLMFVAVMFAVAAALLHNYIEKMALSNHAKQYHRMEKIYRAGSRRLRKLVEENGLEEAQNEIRNLGDAALGENGDWVLTHRDRPLEVPHH